MRATAVETECSSISSELYSKLEEETGIATGYKQCGAISLAQTKDRLIYLRRAAVNARAYGIETHEISPDEIKERHPLIKTENLAGGLWIPGDATANPSDVTQSLIRGAINRGVKLHEKVEVTSIETINGHVYSVVTNQGKIQCEYFINCGGMWARDIGLRSDPVVKVPLHACEHYYLVTKPIRSDINVADLPTIRDLDSSIYIREWSGGLLAGGFEPLAKPAFYKGIPKPYEFQMLPEDWDHFQVLLDGMLGCVPMLEKAEVRQLFNGAESFTPDLKYIMGEAPNVKNYYVLAGMNSSGIAGSGGAGKLLADWIVNGEQPMNMWPVDIRRFCQHQNNKAYLRDRVKEVLGMHYQIRYPYQEYQYGRKLRCSPLYPRLQEYNAVFGEKLGFERANWFITEEYADDFLLQNNSEKGTFCKPNWYEIVKSEYKVCREAVGVLDMSSFSKFEIKSAGNEATKLLQHLCVNEMDMPVGNVVHTAMLNRHGCYETDCSVARFAHNHYFIISPSDQVTRNFAWITKHIPEDKQAAITVTDATSRYTALNVMGPKSRELLQQITSTSLNSTDFKPFTCKEISAGYASGIKALAMTHSGELGWMLYIPNEFALSLYDLLMDVGKDFGIRNVGYYALRYLRIEKFFAFMGQDFNSTHTPFEIGREFKVDFKASNFIGKTELSKKKNEGVKRRLAMFLLDDHDRDKDLWPWGGEAIYRNGQMTGLTTSIGCGFTLNKMICIGWVTNKHKQTGVRQLVTNDYVIDGHYEIEINTKRFTAKPRLYTPALA
uniref:Pyruvate dehydrogenase phosphatase regulatory subunit, mitochondrial-like n=1 Tax=Saccoglossus kowalevskii TaxID=10224 RepID=A0ABM0MK73_SACKO|nr:PREDICTED: pyruvate dehydrogenase phosphatase regulatory subunit, mitochondrial-like [Saccoglossus kowalevskii]